MTDLSVDILIIGSGLGATAAARRLSQAGRCVVLVPGIGRTRSPHIDGGLVDASLVESAFGPDAPLGEMIVRQRSLQPLAGHRFAEGDAEALRPGLIYRRGELEGWAMERATGVGATFLDAFIEGQALPNSDGSMTLTSERDARTITARTVVICEGADPRIPLRVKLRPDYGPEDQIHFARTLFRGEPPAVLRRGTWRTSWGMPVGITLIPQHDGTLVSVSARIENVMRGSRSAKDALEELLASAEFDALGISGTAREIGVELVALRWERNNILFEHDRMVMGVDASGVIDARLPERANLTIQSGLLLADTLLNGSLSDWPVAARSFIRGSIPAVSAYHDDRGTGYLEEVSSSRAGLLGKRIAGLARRVRLTSAQQG